MPGFAGAPASSPAVTAGTRNRAPHPAAAGLALRIPGRTAGTHFEG